jgi:hypothetical protein
MPRNATAGNGWKRNVAGGVNDAEITAVLQQKMQRHFSFSFIIFLFGRYCAYACMWHALSRHFFGLVQVLISYI